MKTFYYNSTDVSKFSTLLEQSHRIAIISHTNPDGDAIGSALGLIRYIRNLAKLKEVSIDIRAIVPNHFPAFLSFIDSGRDVEIYKDQIKETEAFVAAADMIICVDFNQPHRLEGLSSALDMNFSAKRVLIDHHIDPSSEFDIVFHSTASSSTALLVYKLIEQISGIEAIDASIGEALYVGMMTDTGCFSYSNLDAELFRSVANLVEAGVDAVKVHREVFDTQTENRVRLVGYLLDNKMVVNSAKKAAYIALTQAEKDKHGFQIGDSEGIVNMPLSIKGIDFSVILIENKDLIKVSLRSQGDIDVNVLGRTFFNGGGHKNAAGGKLNMTIEEAIKFVEKIISEQL